MTIEPDTPEHINPNNEHSLKKLAWAITASQGKFKLIFARCNYTKLRKTLVQRSQEICQAKIHTITLKPSDTTLYAAISAQLGEETPGGLMILGLETVANLEQMLSSANQVRETFREKFYFPLVLWVNDNVKKHLMELAPDLESWGTSTQFELGADEVVNLLQKTTETIFKQSIAENIDSLSPTQANDNKDYQELELGYNNLQAIGQELEPELKADLDFVFGEQAYFKNDFDGALAYYQNSLDWWRASAYFLHPVASGNKGKLNPQIKVGILQVKLGLCYFQKASEDKTKSKQEYLKSAIGYFKECAYPDLCLKFSNIIGKILQSLEAWDELEQLAQKGLQAAIGGLDINIAPLHGFLATVALKQSRWEQAKESAQTALEIAEVQQQFLGNYLLVLAEAEYHLGETAIARLERAREIGVEDDPRVYLNILKRLREFYLEQKEYFKAYQVKQDGQVVEYEYGFRAFIGASRIKVKTTAVKGESLETIAPEIVASGREKDVTELVRRVIDPNHKVIVIYGYSGVGKSSLVNAGLFPILEQNAVSLPGIVSLKEIVPVALRVYTNWVEELGKQLTNALHKKRINLIKSLHTQEAILEQLQESEAQNIQVVLILDQFEEFFFIAKTKSASNELFLFLGKCLENLSVKLIFSLRRDYLHFLVDRPKIKNVSGGMLSEDKLYKITNFYEYEAENIINKLTKRSNFTLEDKLIKQLVKDLAGEYRKVRPIELQIVGAQLQEKNIRTLEEYQNFGTKEELVKRYLDSVVADCGEENQEIAKLFLYLLTDDNGTRPLKTRVELEVDLQKLLTIEANKIGLVSQILVASGLVFIVPENPDERYQLVHDYLVTFIRQEQEPKIKELIAELEIERKQRKELENSIQKVKEDLAVVLVEKNHINQEVQLAQENKEKLELEIQKAQQKLTKVQAEREGAIAGIDLERQSILAIKKLESHPFEALLLSMQIGRKLQKLAQSGRTLEKYPTVSPILVLQNSLIKNYEKNQLTGHQDRVWSATFSPDGSKIVTASDDNTAKIWDIFGKEIATLTGHQNRVWSATFSPDGSKIVTASDDKTARIWDIFGKKIATLIGHQDWVLSATFSPDGSKIVTASGDKTGKIWDILGKEIATLTGHQDWVRSATFSPDGSKIVTASEDNTAKIWDILGKEIASLRGHQGWVRSAIFSPDGTKIVTASEDNTAKIWDINGKEVATLTGHQDWVWSATFSPNGTKIVTASGDKTAKIWGILGKEIATLSGHQSWVWSATFSPDGSKIVTASEDNTGKIWDILGKEIASLSGHQDRVRSATFSPDSSKIVTASEDKAGKIWDINGKEIATLTGHQGRVWSATFSPDGSKIVTASQDNTAKIWDIFGKEIVTLSGHQDWVRSARFSPDGSKIVTASDDNTAKIWDILGKEIATITGHQGRVWSARFSPDGSKIVTASQDNTAKIWDILGKEIATLTGHQDWVWSARFSPDGSKIVTASDDNTAKIWDINGKEIASLTGHQGWVRSATFSPDGLKIVTASDDNTAKIWDINGKEIASLTGHQSRVSSATFSPDGTKIVTASEDNTGKIWQVESLDQQLDRGCAWLHDYFTSHPYVDRSFCP